MSSIRVRTAVRWALTLGVTALLGLGCSRAPAPVAPPALSGAWHASVQFQGGAFASVKDLEFLFVFNSGGTMTESSNYDGLPPVPPAYGEWRATGADQFEAKYTFFTTRPPEDVKSLATGGGWLPAGHGMLKESIHMAADGRAYDSTIALELFDMAGKPVSGGGSGTVHATRSEW